MPINYTLIFTDQTLSGQIQLESANENYNSLANSINKELKNTHKIEIPIDSIKSSLSEFKLDPNKDTTIDLTLSLPNNKEHYSSNEKALIPTKDDPLFLLLQANLKSFPNGLIRLIIEYFSHFSSFDRFSTPPHTIQAEFIGAPFLSRQGTALGYPTYIEQFSFHNDGKDFYIHFKFIGELCSNKFLNALKEHKPSDLTLEESNHSLSTKTKSTIIKPNLGSDIEVDDLNYFFKTVKAMDFGIRVAVGFNYLGNHAKVFLLGYYGYCMQPTGLFWHRVLKQNTNNWSEPHLILVSNKFLSISFDFYHQYIKVRFLNEQDSAVYKKNHKTNLQTPQEQIEGLTSLLDSKLLSDDEKALIFHIVDSLKNNNDMKPIDEPAWKQRKNGLRNYSRSRGLTFGPVGKHHKETAKKLFSAVDFCANKTEETLRYIIDAGTTPEQRNNTGGFAGAISQLLGETPQQRQQRRLTYQGTLKTQQLSQTASQTKATTRTSSASTVSSTSSASTETKQNNGANRNSTTITSALTTNSGLKIAGLKPLAQQNQQTTKATGEQSTSSTQQASSASSTIPDILYATEKRLGS